MVKQITTFIPNVPGALASFCRTLKKYNIDMRAMNVGDAMEFGIVRVIVDQTEKAVEILQSENFVVHVQEVIALEVEDHPGSLVELLTTLEEAGVNLDYTYALFSGHEHKAAFVIKTQNREKAEEALKSAGIRAISQEELTGF
jgi:hypothetical protein